MAFAARPSLIRVEHAVERVSRFNHAVFECRRPFDLVLENYETGTTDHEREQCAERRRANLDAKLHRGRTEDRTGSAGPLGELQTIGATQGFGPSSQRPQVNHCTIYYECRRSDSSKHTDQMLGTGVIFFPEVNTMLGTSFCMKPIFCV